MKILHVSFSDFDGGASIAACRLHRELLRQGIDSKMLVVHKKLSDDSIVSPLGRWERLLHGLLPKVSHLFLRLQKSGNPVFHSLNLFPGAVFQYILRENPDLVHLHWIGNDMLSIRQIARVPFPIVWTLHDAWPFLGAEHHTATEDDFRFRDGYTKMNSRNCGPDFDRIVWQQKRKYWKDRKFYIVTPSVWLQSKAAQSILFKDFPVTVIPNGLSAFPDLPSKEAARKKLGLPQDKILFGFCAFCLSDANKGGRELPALLKLVSEKHPEIEWVSMGGSSMPEGSWKIHPLGKLISPEECRLFYAAINVLVMTSRIENFPNTLLESLSCGTPCAAFRVGGIPEIIRDGSGFTAQPCHTEELLEAALRAVPLKGKVSLPENCRIGNCAAEYRKLYCSILK